jgi:hypothetical protein
MYAEGCLHMRAGGFVDRSCHACRGKACIYALVTFLSEHLSPARRDSACIRPSLALGNGDINML